MSGEKYGFVYIWYDRKHKRYYIGCRWGQEDDGYICSSPWMKAAYKRRPQDFKRRILETLISDRQTLLEREYAWLQLTKPDELAGIRYYNLHNHKFNHWSAGNDAISIAKKSGMTRRGIKHGPMSEERKANISAAKKGIPRSEAHNQALKAAGRKPMTEEHKIAISEGNKRAYAEGKRQPRPKKERRPLYAPGERQKQLWADPVWAANQRQKLREAHQRRKVNTSCQIL